MIRTTTLIHGARTTLKAHSPSTGATSCFAVFEYGDDAHQTRVFLDVDQLTLLAEQAVAAVTLFERYRPTPEDARVGEEVS